MRYITYKCDCCGAEIESVPESADKDNRHSVTFEYLSEGLYSKTPSYLHIHVCDECLDKIAKAMASNNGIMDEGVRHFVAKRLEKKYEEDNDDAADTL